MTIWGYLRTSTSAPAADVQRQALTAAGVTVEHLVQDHTEAADPSHPALEQLLDDLVAGDVLTVVTLDRLARSLSQLVQTLDDLARRQVQLRALTEGLDTTTTAGPPALHMVTALADAERALRRERTAAGRQAARTTSKAPGRASRISREQYQLIRTMAAEGAPQRTIAVTCGVPRATVGRIIRGEVPSLAARYDDVNPSDGELPIVMGAP